ncbi:hypothetical protein [Niallia sp. FSL R7-0271]|uniref:hypothetical protein n=1 Tax=Niallia sp. FSL R7-0271 TaxID=2921678 RepID=UPI0030F4D2E1
MNMEAYLLETDPKSVAHEHDKRFLRNILKKEKFISVPCSNRSIMRGEALGEVIIEVSSDTELREIIQMVKIMKKRKSPLRPLFQTIAAGIVE